MFINHLQEYAQWALLIVAGFLIVLKFTFMFAMNMRGNYVKLLFASTKIFNQQELRNTFDTKLKKFFEVSNNINVVFYSIIGLIVAAYLLAGMLRS